MSHLGDRLRELRGDESLYEIEKSIGIARTLLSRYERGKHVPSPNALRRLAQHYGVPYEDLRILYFEDAFIDPEERSIVLKWATKHLSASGV